MSFCAFEIHSHMPEKKSRFQAKNKHVWGVEVLQGIFLSNTWPAPTVRHLPLIPLVIWILHKLWGEQECLYYCKQFNDICCFTTNLCFTASAIACSGQEFTVLSAWQTIVWISSKKIWLLGGFASLESSETRQYLSQHFLTAAGDFGDTGSLVAITPASGTCLVCWVLKWFNLSRSLQLMWSMWMKCNYLIYKVIWL